MRYYVITPAKNEEQFISFTIESMIRQTLKPVKWIIVDDGSTDKTMEIVEKYKKEYDWIESISIENKQEKKLYGSKVIKAFYVGYNSIQNDDFEFIVKMDADVQFPAHLYKEIANAFEKDKKIGICSGILVDKDAELTGKKSSGDYIGGPLKCVRMKCFKEIGGFVEANGWDGLDQLKARYMDWTVKKIPVEIVHLRPMTTEYRSLQYFYNNGIAHYRMGNDLFLTLVRSLIHLKQKPYLLASMNYFKGYMNALISKEPKLVDKELARFVKQHHYKKLKKMFMKN